MRVFSFRFIFSAAMGFFLLFFIVFAFWIYPEREGIHRLLENKFGLIFGDARFKVILTHWPDIIFYIMAELWKVALISVLFWGFINQNLPMEKAKRFYPPLMLGTSIDNASRADYRFLHLAVQLELVCPLLAQMAEVRCTY